MNFLKNFDELRVRIVLTTFCSCLESTAPNVANGSYKSLARLMKQLPEHLLPEVLEEIGTDWESVCLGHIQKIQ